MFRPMPLRRDGVDHGTRFRLRPKDGEPRCLLEQLAQYVWVNRISIYTATAVTFVLTLVVLQFFFGVHS